MGAERGGSLLDSRRGGGDDRAHAPFRGLELSLRGDQRKHRVGMATDERWADTVDLGEALDIARTRRSDSFKGSVIGDRVSRLATCSLQPPGPERLEQRLVLG